MSDDLDPLKDRTPSSRCGNCEHEMRMHGEDGCWFCLDVGRIDESLVCKCPVAWGRRAANDRSRIDLR